MSQPLLCYDKAQFHHDGSSFYIFVLASFFILEYITHTKGYKMHLHSLENINKRTIHMPTPSSETESHWYLGSPFVPSPHCLSSNHYIRFGFAFLCSLFKYNQTVFFFCDLNFSLNIFFLRIIYVDIQKKS